MKTLKVFYNFKNTKIIRSEKNALFWLHEEQYLLAYQDKGGNI